MAGHSYQKKTMVSRTVWVSSEPSINMFCVQLATEILDTPTLPKTKQTAPENRPSQKETIVFQPSFFRCELLVSGRVLLTVTGHILWASKSQRVEEHIFVGSGPAPSTLVQMAHNKKAIGEISLTIWLTYSEGEGQSIGTSIRLDHHETYENPT